jgi:hypothetical protein
MGNWIIRWAFDKPTYTPGDMASINFWLENAGDTFLHLSDIEMQFDFGTYHLQSVQGIVFPQTNTLMGRINLALPAHVVGQKVFKLKYRTHEYVSGNWSDLGIHSAPSGFWIGIYPSPLYTAFLSRGLRIEDRVIGDSIAEMIREWGFNTVTIGIEVHASEHEVDIKVREYIQSSDGLIAIATPRFLDALSGLWRALEWYHAELGIAFGIDKPLLILNDSKVSMSGLPSYLTQSGHVPKIEFDSSNLESLRAQFSAVMPGFREWVAAKRAQEFRDTLKRIAVGGLAFIGGMALLNGIAGNVSGTSKRG